MYTAAKAQIDEEFELFTIETVEDVDGNPVQVKKSLGRFRLDELEAQKSILQEQIDDIDEKINAINTLQKEEA